MSAGLGCWRLRLAGALAAVACAAAGHAAPLPVTPVPAQVELRAGDFEVAEGTAIVTPSNDAAAMGAAQRLAEFTRQAGGPHLEPVAGAPRPGAIVLRRAGPAEAGAYTLDITPEGAVVSARSDAGLFHGAMTVWQLITAPRPAGAAVRLPALQVEDAPRFSWRGLMLDSARHYQSPAFIKRLLDAMAAYKLNVLHWHLTDDQAWRLEIRKYPRLTEVGAWRVPAGQGPAADIDAATGRPRLYGGYYSQEQVRDLVAYAAARNITIVPEIDMPGHASAAVVAYPALAATPNPPREVPADWGVYPNLYNTDEATFAFLTDVLDEVVDLFPSKYIHVGGDEAVKDQWKASPRIQAQMKALGLKDEMGLQSWFIRRIEKHLNARGRRLVGWDEILEGGLAPNATVMSWRGIEGAVASARAGHDAVLSPAPVLYFDNRQSESPAEPPGRGRVVSLKEVYAFDPMPAELTAAQRKHILGLQGNLWTEHVRTEERAAHMLFPRALAVAEIGWAPAERRDWEAFLGRLPGDLERLTAFGLDGADTALRPPHAPTDPRRRVNRELKTCTEQLTLALEDDAPVRGERTVFLTDIMNPCWIWEQASLDGIGRIRVEVGQLPFNFQIGEDVEKIPLSPPRTPEGELEVRVGSCEAAPAAVIPLKAAAGDPAVTALEAPLPDLSGRADLCFTFTRAAVDPIWAVASVTLLPEPDR
ncbi:beta-N-acetylhexosaminidase [Phenylobacterium sp.]|jgi:hexosaminidase|uniref:beta-N-acetylhexosaminidase n=1 Tax=Phenylobacterium sp. TaxID=1871053 RepID=UPI002E346D83|nr:beta-N-acetylhexosaminidase [Phenylobacterium sp.]HEX2560429.1 beta-N-acetylhexosaminidase [Phenylobacterium sp.]